MQNCNLSKRFLKQSIQELKSKITLENRAKHGIWNSKIMERKSENWDKKVRKKIEKNKNQRL